MRTRLQFGSLIVPWDLPVAEKLTYKWNPSGTRSPSIVLNSFQQANKIYRARSPPSRLKKGSTKPSMKTEPKLLGATKSEVEVLDASPSKPQDVQSKPTAPRKADNSWDILARALANERASKLTDGSKFQGVGLSCSTVQDDEIATDASSTQRFRPKNVDRSWAILATALEKERESQSHKNPTRNSTRTVVKTEHSPGKSFESSTAGRNFSKELDRGKSTRASTVSPEGKELECWKTKGLKFSIVTAQEKIKRGRRKLSSGYEVVIPASAYRELENGSISPRISPRVSSFVSFILNSHLREEDCLRKKFQIATGLPVRKPDFKFQSVWKHEEFIPRLPCRYHDTGLSTIDYIESAQRGSSNVFDMKGAAQGHRC